MQKLIHLNDNQYTIVAERKLSKQESIMYYACTEKRSFNNMFILHLVSDKLNEKILNEALSQIQKQKKELRSIVIENSNNENNNIADCSLVELSPPPPIFMLAAPVSLPPIIIFPNRWI